MKGEKKYINDELEKDSYLRLKESFKKEEYELRDHLAELQSTDSEFMENMKYGCSVLSNLRHSYDSVDVDAKQKFIGSIFPQKLIFENGKYRTTNESELLCLLCWNGAGLEEMENKNSRKSAGKFAMVAPGGIEPPSEEPESSILSIILRGQSLQS